MINISIDASTSMIGYSIWEDDILLKYGKISPINSNAEWRDRIISLINQLKYLTNEYKFDNMFVEDVPNKPNGGVLTAIKLGAMQGALLGFCSTNNINPVFIKVGTWRHNIGLFDGTKERLQRDNLKIASIDKANELFGLTLQKVFTKGGNFKDGISDDDISDSILIYASTREKYKYKKPIIQIGKRKVG